MGAAIMEGLKKRERDIIGVAVDPPLQCPFCKQLRDVFERVTIDGRVMLICPDCMDKVIKKVREKWEEELNEEYRRRYD